MAATIVSLANGMQILAHEDPEGWSLEAWRRPKSEGFFDREYELVQATQSWRMKKFATIEELIAAFGTSLSR